MDTYMIGPNSKNFLGGIWKYRIGVLNAPLFIFCLLFIFYYFNNHILIKFE